MRTEVIEKREDIAALCRRHGVVRLEVFGSVARGIGFEPLRSDADFLVTFDPQHRDDPAALMEFEIALEALLGMPVDLTEREALEASRNFIRRRRILAEAQLVCG